MRRFFDLAHGSARSDRCPRTRRLKSRSRLSRQVPGAGPAIRGVTTAYVEGTYAGRPPGSDPWPEWLAARRDVLNGMLRRRLRRWLGEDSGVATAPRGHPELLRRWGAARARGWAEEPAPPEETPRS